MFNKVVLPEPLGPTRATIWPAGTLTVTSCRAQLPAR